MVVAIEAISPTSNLNTRWIYFLKLKSIMPTINKPDPYFQRHIFFKFNCRFRVNGQKRRKIDGFSENLTRKKPLETIGWKRLLNNYKTQDFSIDSWITA